MGKGYMELHENIHFNFFVLNFFGFLLLLSYWNLGCDWDGPMN